MSIRRLYGSSPLHLLSLMACFGLAGFAFLQASHGPLPLRMAVWFVAALIGHDLLLFPLYALADRTMSTVIPRRRGRLLTKPGTVNYLRVPALLSSLLLLMFFPVILRKSEGPYGAASGLDQSPYLARWLLLTGIAFGVSALLLAVRSRRSAG